jgi:hypothetical protein
MEVVACLCCIVILLPLSPPYSPESTACHVVCSSVLTLIFSFSFSLLVRQPLAQFLTGMGVMRVNLANALDEGLMIGGRVCQMNSKVKISQTRWGLVCVENKCGTQLAQSQSVPGRPLLAPLYRWPGLEEQVGFNTNYNVCIWCHLIFWLHLCLGLPNRPEGYQDNGPY